jgi:hypothetical protein
VVLSPVIHLAYLTAVADFLASRANLERDISGAATVAHIIHPSRRCKLPPLFWRNKKIT